MDYKQIAANVKADSFKMAALPREVRDSALKAIMKALDNNKEAIFAENRIDLEKAAADNLPAPIQNRLKFDGHKLEDCISGMGDLAAMEDPLFKELLKRQLDEDLTLVKTTCPIGVIGVIFESRPDALVQISSLCIKSGNVQSGSGADVERIALQDELVVAVGILNLKFERRQVRCVDNRAVGVNFNFRQVERSGCFAAADDANLLTLDVVRNVNNKSVGVAALIGLRLPKNVIVGV